MKSITPERILDHGRLLCKTIIHSVRGASKARSRDEGTVPDALTSADRRARGDRKLAK